MSQVQNSCLHGFVQSSLIFTAAFLAGRVIQYFPGATPKGLLLSAAIGSTATFATQNLLLSENAPIWKSLACNVAGLAFAAFFTPYIAHSLKGRADITRPAALKFGIVECVIATGLAIVFSRRESQEIDLLHFQYERNPAAWKMLSQEERTKLVQQFYTKNLSPISLENTDIEEGILENLPPKNFAEMSENQLGWHVQVLKHVEYYTEEALFDINFALHQKGLPMEWDEGINQEIVDYAQDKPTRVNLLYIYFCSHPIEFARIQEGEDPVAFGEMFNGKDPIPDPATYLQGLKSTEDFQKLGPAGLRYIMAKFNDQSLDPKMLPLSQQIAINVAAWKQGTQELLIWPITQEVVTALIATDGAIGWLHYKFSFNSAMYALTDELLRIQLDLLFDQAHFGQITSVESFLAWHPAEKILAWSPVCIWHEYFTKNTLVFNNLSQEKTTAFINAFMINNQPTIPLVPLDASKIDFTQLSNPTSEGVAQIGENSIAWLLRLETMQSFLDQDIVLALQQRQKALTQ